MDTSVVSKTDRLGRRTGPRRKYLGTEKLRILEETGFTSAPPFLPLGELRQKSGKRISAWAFEGDADPAQLVSNLFEMEWPPRSGRMQAFPEVDQAAYFAAADALRKVHRGQRPIVAEAFDAP